MKNKVVLLTVTALTAMLMSATAWASDNIQLTVAGIGTPAPSVKLNGNAITQGTVQLFYTINGFTFPTGDFASFQMDMTSVHIGGANNAVYPATMTLDQNGSENVTLIPAQNLITVNQLGWSGSTTVLIRIPSGVPNVDGTDLVGNLNLRIPGSNHIGTPTSVQVHIRLVYPTACLRAYNFITDQDFSGIVTTASVNVNTKKGMVTGTSNPGQFSDNVLIVNTCAQDESIDLRIALDSRWETNPHDNPGSAVFTYSANGAIDPDSFDISAFASKVSNKENLCIQNVTIPAGTTFLAGVHSEVIKQQSISNLGTAPFYFEGYIHQASTACGGPLNSVIAPNPVSVTLPFIQQ